MRRSWLARAVPESLLDRRRCLGVPGCEPVKQQLQIFPRVGLVQLQVVGVPVALFVSVVLPEAVVLWRGRCSRRVRGAREAHSRSPGSPVLQASGAFRPRCQRTPRHTARHLCSSRLEELPRVAPQDARIRQQVVDTHVVLVISIVLRRAVILWRRGCSRRAHGACSALSQTPGSPALQAGGARRPRCQRTPRRAVVRLHARRGEDLVGRSRLQLLATLVALVVPVIVQEVVVLRHVR
eukprot:CAMPEP_0203907314 /NCGR_PEP_ID=MMETSP0359-20131031/48824_1 /ASSEMBLY_ACC=CAM_ASM_000338 /TAXON_ID=268821 /ORGANISM="Scrippsiella Hangoei, Strain SHTV-5" /LENGTH=237 /DNA_ID=CAMNT_0050832107 /DNA_START=224 /DNA_END=937 /DNA_ORIENTATION=-